MVGHKDERYLFFGRVSARLDDLANFVPARLTFLALVAATWLGAGHPRRRARAKEAWRAALADAPKHDSPNAGWPEAALAGALGVRLGGTNYYDGEPLVGPTFCPAGRRAEPEDIPAAIALIELAAWLVLALGLAAGLAVIGVRASGAGR